ncbi:hypothetical protein EDD95_7398 [Streptomyces sp. CEV 2-1]|uniref:HAD family hydrolase n=1 Tax=Streptomyces sp. CEV 2-1 TaxID=2485153 RepID=UPI000FB2081B|nr:hypothetical protein EDD95_7398 [Streptomyces sp. CEV 2-1]
MLLPRLIDSDLDGTLLRDDGTLSPRALRALELEISAPRVTEAGTLPGGQGIDAAEVIAFGDMPNDLTVLDRAGTGTPSGVPAPRQHGARAPCPRRPGRTVDRRSPARRPRRWPRLLLHRYDQARTAGVPAHETPMNTHFLASA